MGPGNTYDTAIIGAGASGAAALVALAQRVTPDHRVAIFDPRPPGPGTAYGDAQSPSLLMNGPARAMSIVPGDETHLVRWLRDEPGHALISRRRYGEYLRATLAATFARNPDFTHRATEITAVEAHHGTYLLADRDGREYGARNVVFALGNALPGDAFLPDVVRAHRGYVRNPWTFETAPLSGDVAIIGSRLTAMDVVARLEESDFPGRVFLISRHGIVPQREETRVTAVDASELGLDTRTALAMVRSVRRAAQVHVEHGGDWRAVIEAIRPMTSHVWLGWPERERRRFLRHVQSFWSAYRYRVPQQTYRSFERLVANGKLLLVPGRITGAEACAENTLRMRITRADRATFVKASTIVNATGPNADYSTIENPLVVSALHRGLLRSDPLHLGLDVNRTLNCISSAGLAQPHVFALGPALRGRFYESTAIPEIRAHARTISEAIASLDARVSLGAVS